MKDKAFHTSMQGFSASGYVFSCDAGYKTGFSVGTGKVGVLSFLLAWQPEMKVIVVAGRGGSSL